MSLAVVYSRAHVGIGAPLVSIEVHLSSGLPTLNMVGLAETSVRESKDRVRSAIINAGFDFPMQRITINLAPADLPKEGGRFDLAIAMGVLVASQQIPATAIDHYEFLAELALTSELKPCPAVLSASLACKIAGRKLVVALPNADEATMPKQTQVMAPNNLNELCQWFLYPEKQRWHRRSISQTQPAKSDQLNLDEIHGQEKAKRALLIAASGGHHIIFCGPPGAGKTMLAKRLHGLLPELTEPQAMEVGTIQSSIGMFDPEQWRQVPWRAPHHNASAAALVGGGRNPRAGEISRAHLGVLFLDELAEFPRHVLDNLRQPLESGHIDIARAQQQIQLPAKFMLIAATNPCPCGYYGDPDIDCRCSSNKIANYMQRLSGPLLDRIDIQVSLQRPSSQQLLNPIKGVSTAQAQQVVLNSRQFQQQRQGKLNNELIGNEITQWVALTEEQQHLLEAAVSKLALSPRALHKVLRVARSIADLEACKAVSKAHILESIGYQKGANGFMHT